MNALAAPLPPNGNPGIVPPWLRRPPAPTTPLPTPPPPPPGDAA